MTHTIPAPDAAARHVERVIRYEVTRPLDGTMPGVACEARECAACGQPWPCLVHRLAREVERLTAELDRLHTWQGVMALLDEHYPADIFPTLPDDPKRDAGPRIVSLLRVIDGLRAEMQGTARLNFRGKRPMRRVDE